jgi:hypothetical protein
MSTEDKQNYIDFNLNDKILVKLHPIGYEHWMSKCNNVFERAFTVTQNESVKQHIKGIEYFKSRENADGYISFQAWDFMNIFGESIWMGGEQMFDINIKVECKDNSEMWNKTFLTANLNNHE